MLQLPAINVASETAAWLVVNKMDLVAEEPRRIESRFDTKEVVNFVSSKTGAGVDELVNAVAGFAEPELNIEVKENTLTIRGEKQVKAENEAEPLYQGIAARAFERVFQLADYVQVKGASLENGLLHVDLVREIPEAKKPRQIQIGKANGNGKPVVVEAKAAA